MNVYTELRDLGFYLWIRDNHGFPVPGEEELKELNATPVSDLTMTAIRAMVLRYFREVNGMNACIMTNATLSGKVFSYYITGSKHDNAGSGFTSYEEAELACLRKLIEIVKSKKDETN